MGLRNLESSPIVLYFLEKYLCINLGDLSIVLANRISGGVNHLKFSKIVRFQGVE